MKKYIIKGNECIYKNCKYTKEPNPSKQGYLESYWYFGMEQYSFRLTKNISKAQQFDTRKQAENAISIIGWGLVNYKVIPIELNIKITK